MWQCLPITVPTIDRRLGRYVHVLVNHVGHLFAPCAVAVLICCTYKCTAYGIDSKQYSGWVGWVSNSMCCQLCTCVLLSSTS